MKKLLFVLLVFPVMSFAVEFNAMTVKPTFLELKKIISVNGVMQVKYVHEKPRVVVDIVYNSKEIHDLMGSLKESELERLNCDADFSLVYNNFGKQFIQINSIKSCLDDEDSVVAHSVGMDKMSDAQVATSAKFLKDAMRPTAIVDSKVNDSRIPKPVVEDNKKAGVLSGKLSKTVSK